MVLRGFCVQKAVEGHSTGKDLCCYHVEKGSLKGCHVENSEWLIFEKEAGVAVLRGLEGLLCWEGF